MTIAHDCISVDTLNDARSNTPALGSTRTIRIGLLGLGHVGSAIARRRRRRRIVAAPGHHGARPRPACVGETVEALLSRPIPRPCSRRGRRSSSKRSAASSRRERSCSTRSRVGIPVVTANKSLLAHHGDELFDAARHDRRPASLRGQRHRWRAVPGHLRCAGRTRRDSPPQRHRQRHDQLHPVAEWSAVRRDYEAALSEAQRRGFAEPDPVEGRARHRRRRETRHPHPAVRRATRSILRASETVGIDDLTASTSRMPARSAACSSLWSRLTASSLPVGHCRIRRSGVRAHSPSARASDAHDERLVPARRRR